jgi:glutathione S-transferase
MITLYNMPLALNCYKVRLLFSLLGVEYRRESIDLLKNEHQTAEFLALNPFGQLPVLKDGDFVLRDSQAILVWAARRFGGDRWMPGDINDEAIVNSWLSAAAYEIRLGPYDARLKKLFPWLCVNADAVETNTARALRLYEQRLTGRNWIALDRPTVADVAPYPALAQCGDGDVSLADYPAIRAWMGRVQGLPGFVDILG